MHISAHPWRLVARVTGCVVLALVAACTTKQLDSANPDLGRIYTGKPTPAYVDDIVTVNASVTDAQHDDSEDGTTVRGVSVTFTIADPSIAELTTPATVVTTSSLLVEAGKAIAMAQLHTLKVGTTTLTATVNGQVGSQGQILTTTSTIKVRAPSRIVFSPAPLAVERLATSAPIAAYIETTSGDTLYGKPVKWSCPAGESVVKLFVNGATECGGEAVTADVRPVQLGATTVRASLPDALFARYPISADAAVTVTAAIARMDLATPAPMTVGTSMQLVPTFRDAAGNVLATGISDAYGPLLNQLQWSGSNAAVAMVDNHGNVNALQAGTLTVTAQYYGPTPNFNTPPLFTASAVVTVINAAGSYAFNVLTAPLTIPAGGTQTDVVQINRTNFTGGVTVTGTSDEGITATPSETPSTGTQTTLTVQVPSTATARTHTVTLTGVAPGRPNVITTFAVVVTSVTNTTYNFCSATGLPVWVAAQDGGTTAAWVQSTSTTSQYAFNITSGKGGIAWVVNVAGVNQLHVFYGTQAEIQAQGASACSGSGSTKTVGGSILNAGSTGRAYLSLGQAYRIVTLPATSFQWSAVAPGALDVVASVTDAAFPPVPQSMLIRRNVNATDGTFLDPFDFGVGSSEAFVPQQTSLTLANSLSQQINLAYQLHTVRNFLSNYYSDASSSALTARNVFGVPAAKQLTDDMHFISAVANGSGSGAVPFRTAGMMVKALTAPFTLTFGSALTAPTISAPGAGVLRAAFGVQAEYNKLWQADYDQISSSAHFATVQMTAGYLGAATTANLDLPNFTGTLGWLSSYGLSTGVSTPWKATAASWSTAGATFPLFVDGATYTAATAQGTITP